MGDKPYVELAEEHGVEEQTVAVFKMNHKGPYRCCAGGLDCAVRPHLVH